MRFLLQGTKLRHTGTSLKLMVFCHPKNMNQHPSIPRYPEYIGWTTRNFSQRQCVKASKSCAQIEGQCWVRWRRMATGGILERLLGKHLPHNKGYSGNLTQLLKITILIGKTSINGPFSIAMLNYQRVLQQGSSKERELNNCVSEMMVFNTSHLARDTCRISVDSYNTCWMSGGWVSRVSISNLTTGGPHVVV